jgi:hypothetical protein
MELSYFEILQMVDSTINRLESVFQFWLSATFAAIVASHLAGEKLTKLYAGVLTSIYLVFTFSVAVRITAWRSSLEQYLLRASEVRGDAGDSAVFGLINMSLWATIILGTIATVVFIWHSYRSQSSTPSV